jgi:hypothetical protein
VQHAGGPSLKPLFDGPYRVIAEDTKLVLVQLGKHWISEDRIKPYIGVAVHIPAARKRPGRPCKDSGREGVAGNP